LVLNDSKVLTCRLQGRRATGGKIEVLLLNEKPGLVFEALIKPARIKVGEKIIFDDQKISCVVNARNEVAFSGCDKEETSGKNYDSNHRYKNQKVSMVKI
jgi:S-adenosylmethionine:tRNA ribosyltransferase-isomerase